MRRDIQLLISEEFTEKIILENNSVHLLDEIVDKLDCMSCIIHIQLLAQANATVKCRYTRNLLSF